MALTHSSSAQGGARSTVLVWIEDQGHSEGVGGGSHTLAGEQRDWLIIVVFIPGRIEATAEGETKDIKF